MSRSLNNITGNVSRSLNNLSGNATNILSGEAININETDESDIYTADLIISKQSAVTTVADDDLLVLESSSGAILKITGVHLKDACDGFFYLNNSVNIIADNTADNLVLGASANAAGYKFLCGGVAKFQANIDVDSLATFNQSIQVSNGTSTAGFINILEKGVEGVTHKVQLKATEVMASDKVITLPDLTGTVVLLNSLSATNPIVYDGAGAFSWTNSNNYITLGSLSASNPIVYNNSTGAFTWTNSNNYIALGSLSATSPIQYNSSTGVVSTLFTTSSTDNLYNKTFATTTTFEKSIKIEAYSASVSAFIRFFEKGDAGENYIDLHVKDMTIAENVNVYLPNVTGNIALISDITSAVSTANRWNDGSNIYTPSNSSLTSIDLPADTKLRNAGDLTNDYIQFDDTNSSLYSNMHIDIKEGKMIRNAGDRVNDWVQFSALGGVGYLNINFANVTFIEDCKLSNAGDLTNDYIQFKADKLYINYANVELKQDTKISNASATDNFIQFIAGDTCYHSATWTALNGGLEARGANHYFMRPSGTAVTDYRLGMNYGSSIVYLYDPHANDDGTQRGAASTEGCFIRYHDNGTELGLNCPSVTYKYSTDSNVAFRFAGENRVRITGSSAEMMQFWGIGRTSYNQVGTLGCANTIPANFGDRMTGESMPFGTTLFIGGANINDTQGSLIGTNGSTCIIINSGDQNALQWFDTDVYDGTQTGWLINNLGAISTFSDIRVKDKIETWKISNFEKYKKIRTVKFKMKPPPDMTAERCAMKGCKDKYNIEHLGVIAQELFEIYPELECSDNIRKRDEQNWRKDNWSTQYIVEHAEWVKRKEQHAEENKTKEGEKPTEFKVKEPNPIWNEEELLKKIEYQKISLLSIGVIQELIKTVEYQQTIIDKLTKATSFAAFKKSI